MGGDWQRHTGHVGDERRPAGRAVHDHRSADVTAAGLDAGDLATGALATGAGAALDVDVEDLGLLDDVDAVVVGTACVAPDHCVVADDAAWRVVECPQDRVAGVRRDVEAGGLLLDLLRIDDAGVDALELVDLGPPVHGAQRGVGVGQREVASFGEHDVQVQVGSHCPVQLERAVVEGHTLGREVVGAHDGGVAARPASTDVTLVEHGHVRDAVVRGQVVGRGEAVQAGADNDDVVGVTHLGAAPHPGPVASCQAVLDQRSC